MATLHKIKDSATLPAKPDTAAQSASETTASETTASETPDASVKVAIDNTESIIVLSRDKSAPIGAQRTAKDGTLRANVSPAQHAAAFRTLATMDPSLSALASDWQSASDGAPKGRIALQIADRLAKIAKATPAKAEACTGAIGTIFAAYRLAFAAAARADAAASRANRTATQAASTAKPLGSATLASWGRSAAAHNLQIASEARNAIGSGARAESAKESAKVESGAMLVTLIAGE